MSLPRMIPKDQAHTIDGPARIYGYDGNVYPRRATHAQWRAHRLWRARQKGTHTEAEWCELRDRTGHCVGCGVTGVFLAKDHIHPIARGGCDCIENLQPLCEPCNSKKRDRVEGMPL